MRETFSPSTWSLFLRAAQEHKSQLLYSIRDPPIRDGCSLQTWQTSRQREDTTVLQEWRIRMRGCEMGVSPFAVSEVIRTKGACLHSTGLHGRNGTSFPQQAVNKGKHCTVSHHTLWNQANRGRVQPHCQLTQSSYLLRMLQSVKVSWFTVYWDKPCSCHAISLAQNDKVSAHASLATSYDILIGIIPLFRQEQAASWLLQPLRSDGKKHSFVIVQTISSTSGGRLFFPLSLQLHVCTRHLCQQRWCKIQHNCFHGENAGNWEKAGKTWLNSPWVSFTGPQICHRRRWVWFWWTPWSRSWPSLPAHQTLNWKIWVKHRICTI